ncbi:MAG TPA: MFS transporter [Phenylobacterium sp.]|jgi:putative MFS transporter
MFALLAGLVHPSAASMADMAGMAMPATAKPPPPLMAPADPMMLLGMSLIIGGTALACYGLFPKRGAALTAGSTLAGPPELPERIGRSQWLLMGVLTVALVIDTMKPATLGFVLPGMRAEYGLSRAQVAWFPFLALTGTVVGSLVWGWICDFYGRRAAILLATIGFIGTSICGAMPSFGWNLVMCFLMGASAGGMLPVAYALLTETLPARSRGWALVLVGGLGAAGGYVAASTAAALLEPSFTWRALWLLGLPTGTILILLNRYIPESPDFMHSASRGAAAHMERPPATRPTLAMILLLAALTLVGLAWGLVNFGLLLWLPSELIARGQDVKAMSGLLSKSALLAAPLVLAVAFGYARWSGKWTLIAAIGVMVAGLCGLLALDVPRLGALIGPYPGVVLLVIGVNGVIATILPYAAEQTPAAIRGRATGWVAGSSKAGGLLAQLLGMASISPGLTTAAVFTALLLVLSALLLSLNDRPAARAARLAALAAATPRSAP